MNRRSFLAVTALFSFAPRSGDAKDDQVAEVIYGPSFITSPSGEGFWMLATRRAAFAIPEYDTLRGIFPDDEDFALAVRYGGEWLLIDGWPNRWSHTEMRWVPLL